MRLSTLLLSAVVLVLVGPGCKRLQEKAGQKAIEQQTGGQVQLEGDNMTIKTDAGTVSIGANATLPADFPKTVPVYPGAKVDMAATSAQNGKKAWSVTLSSDDSHEKVATFYKSGMAGFTQASSMNMGDTDMSVFQNAQYDVTILVATGASGTTRVTMTVASR